MISRIIFELGSLSSVLVASISSKVGIMMVCPKYSNLEEKRRKEEETEEENDSDI